MWLREGTCGTCTDCGLMRDPGTCHPYVTVIYPIGRHFLNHPSFAPHAAIFVHSPQSTPHFSLVRNSYDQLLRSPDRITVEYLNKDGIWYSYIR